MKKWDGAIVVPLEKIEPNAWNPNEQTDATFNMLVEEIRTNGFDEPIIVVPSPGKPDMYRIIGGEHRWKAARILEMTEVPVVVKENWDEETQKTQTVKRNLLRGDLDRVKFSKLVNDVIQSHGVPVEQLISKMGFIDEKDFEKAYIVDKETEEQAAEVLADAKGQMQMVDNLSYLLNEIFSKFGSTCPQGFMFFMFKNRMHLMVQMDKELEDQVSLMVGDLKTSGKNVNDFIGTAIGREMAVPKEETQAAPGGKGVEY